jgi:hypothetical protein
MAGMDAQPADSKTKGIPRSLLLYFPWLLIVVVAVVALSYWHWLSVPRTTVARFNACIESAAEAKQKAKGQLDMQDIRACEKLNDASVEDLVKAPIDELKWTLEIIGSLAAFFVIAQGAAAYFSATSYATQADKSVADMDKALTRMNEAAKSIDKIQQGIKRRYPLFEELEKDRTSEFEELKKAVERLSVSGSGQKATEALSWNIKQILYPSIRVENRQKILSLESFASIDLNRGTASTDDWSENLRRYAIFYQSKFEYERSMGSASFGDLERAEGYLRKAIDLTKSDFTLLNDLGVLCLDVHRLRKAGDPGKAGYADEYRTEAEKQFRLSLALEPNQQRAHYNCSVVHSAYYDDKETHYDIARQELMTALGLPKWQQFPPVHAVKALLFYNLACSQGWLLANKAAGVLTEEASRECLGNLRQAVELGTEGIEAIGKNTVERDFKWDSPGTATAQPQNPAGKNDEGDFVELYRKANQGLRDALDKVRKELLELVATAAQAQR